MASVRKLTQEEVAQLRRRGTRVDLTAYLAALSALSVGDWGAIELEPGEKVATVKRRATAAAKQQGKRLLYRRLHEGMLPFEVCPAEGDAEEQARPQRAAAGVQPSS
jgi:hypothetical protein